MILKKIKGKYKGFITICRCDNCGKEFKKWYCKAIKVKHQFCSRECGDKWHKGKNHPMYGRKHTDETKTKWSKERVGKKLYEENYNWKGGRRLSHDGYVLILKHYHPNCDTKGYVRGHRLVMEEYLGRYLAKKEIVHHINKIKTDNRIENLMLFANNSEHSKYHRELSKSYIIGS